MASEFTFFAQGWTNPISLNGEWNFYGIGDPYIIKYKGTYYLYSSTRDNLTGIKCWKSKDLIHWSDAITCSTDPITKTAYAPEVMYWNGNFYMYTSPNGGGHYVLSSTSPEGPFVAVTDNFGKSIDGSVFIDDDSSWYFYHSDFGGIMGCSMSSPTSFGTSKLLGARISNQWTEGPCVFKRNGTYYLIYTGNHVISKGYRIDYAKNTTAAIGNYTPLMAQNPILIKTEGDFSGLGHGTAFIGPDLDTYYFTYHNKAGDYGVGPYRKFNFDRIAWNGDKMMILGATNWSQQTPQVATADYFERMDVGSNWSMPNGGNWGIANNDHLFQDVSDEAIETWHKVLYQSSTGDDYTAEFTIKEVQRSKGEGKLGAIFGYSDEQNFGIALFRGNTNKLEINFLVDGNWGSPNYYDLPIGFDCTVWHGMRIEKYNNQYKFFVDGMKKAELSSTLGGGKIGYMTSWCKGDFAYIAFSNKVQGSGIFEVYKPIPGSIAAVHYNTGGEGVGYHDLTTENIGDQYIRKDAVDIRDCSEGGFNIGWNQTGEWYKYNVNVEATRVYNVGLRYTTAMESCKVRLWQGNTDLTGIIELPATGGWNSWKTYVIKGLDLNAGFQTLKIEIVSGEFDFYEMQFVAADNEVISLSDDFNDGYSDEWNYSDGSWSVESGKAKINGFGKKTMGSTGWTDYSIEVDITYINQMNAGLIFRVNNPANGGADNDPGLGTDFFQGYFVGIENSSVTLGKQNYNWTHLASATGSYSLNTTYHLKVVTEGANIKVYVDDMLNPVLEYTDTHPFISGKVGLRSCNVHVHFDNFSLTTNNQASSNVLDENSNLISKGNIYSVFPNPVRNMLYVNTSNNAEVKFYTLSGQLISSHLINPKNDEINIQSMDKGIYIVRIMGDGTEVFSKLIVKE